MRLFLKKQNNILSIKATDNKKNNCNNDFLLLTYNLDNQLKLDLYDYD